MKQAEVDVVILQKVINNLNEEYMTSLTTHKTKEAKAYGKIVDRLIKVHNRTHNKLYPAQGTHTDAN